MQFIGERDGAAEDDLKRRLRPLLRRMEGVIRAYLPRVEHPAPREYVLAVFGSLGYSDTSALLDAFSEIFSPGDRLNIVTLSGPESRDLQGICPAFYERAEA